MKLIKCLLLSLLTFPLLTFAKMANSPTYKVPFYFVEIQQGTEIHVEYSFDPLHQVLVCFNTGQGPAYVEWQYQHANHSAGLYPNTHITLKDNSYPEGYLADPQGILIIDSLVLDRPKVIMSCEYQMWG